MKIALLFPGYGSQYVGMGKELHDQSRIMQEYFEEAGNCLSMNFTKLAFASSELDLGSMSNAYTTEFLVSASIWAVLKNEGIVPNVVAGYNLGAYAALFAAGGISFPDGLYLLNKFAQLYQEALMGMPAVEIIRVKGIDTKMLEKQCAQVSKQNEMAAVALILRADDHIVTGTSIGVEALKENLGKDVEIHELPREVGLHSSLLDGIVDTFSMYLEKVDFKDLPVALADSISGRRITSGQHAKQLIIDLINKPIHWYSTMQALADNDLIVQIGPGTDLIELFAQEYPDKKVLAINQPADVEELKSIFTLSLSKGKKES